MQIKSLFHFKKQHPLCKNIVKLDKNGNIALEDNVFASLGNPSIICEGNVYISQGTSFHGDGVIEFGNNCFVNNNCWFASSKSGGIYLGEDCAVGPNCVFVDNDHINHNCKLMEQKYIIDSIHIGKNVWIGAGAIILRGTILGDNCIVGAGSVVKGVFGDNLVLAGNPAKIIKRYENS